MSQEEIVDIVDNNDQVIYQTTKIQAHQEGLLHRTVIAELIDSHGNWTLVKQASDKQDAGQYVSPVGGHVTAGESVEDALARESLEEVGIKPKNYKFVGKKIFNRKVLSCKENHYFIVYEIYSDDTLTLNHESVSFKKFSQQELPRQLQTQPQLFGEAFHFVIDSFYPKLRP